MGMYGAIDTSKPIFVYDLTSFLVKIVCFSSDPYDVYLVKKNTEGEQYTILWHSDDLMILDKDDNVVTSGIKSLK